MQIIPHIGLLRLKVQDILDGEDDMDRDDLVLQYLIHMARQKHSMCGGMAEALIRLYSEPIKNKD